MFYSIKKGLRAAVSFPVRVWNGFASIWWLRSIGQLSRKNVIELSKIDRAGRQELREEMNRDLASREEHHKTEASVAIGKDFYDSYAYSEFVKDYIRVQKIKAIFKAANIDWDTSLNEDVTSEAGSPYNTRINLSRFLRNNEGVDSELIREVMSLYSQNIPVRCQPAPCHSLNALLDWLGSAMQAPNMRNFALHGAIVFLKEGKPLGEITFIRDPLDVIRAGGWSVPDADELPPAFFSGAVASREYTVAATKPWFFVRAFNWVASFFPSAADRDTGYVGTPLASPPSSPWVPPPSLATAPVGADSSQWGPGSGAAGATRPFLDLGWGSSSGSPADGTPQTTAMCPRR